MAATARSMLAVLAVALSVGAAASAAEAASACKGMLYLTLDTGTMEPAQQMADILKKHGVKATFFLADEKTFRGDTSLDPA